MKKKIASAKSQIKMLHEGCTLPCIQNKQTNKTKQIKEKKEHCYSFLPQMLVLTELPQPVSLTYGSPLKHLTGERESCYMYKCTGL